MKFDISDAKAVIQSILDNTFREREKRVIKKRVSYFSFACPVCGDSKKNMSAKRGTLYFNTLLYRCFNCGHRSNLLSVAKQSGINIDIDTKLGMVDYVDEAFSRVQFQKDEFMNSDLDKILDIKDVEEFFNTSDRSPFSSFRPVTKGSAAWRYLVHERQIFNHDCIYEATHWMTDSWSEPVIIFMNMSSSGKVLGLQSRNMEKDKRRRRFRIFSFSEIYDLLNPDNPLDELEEIGYNKLSYLFNIMNIDFTKPITIFEGFLDTKFFPNSIGMVGKETDPSLLYDKELDLRFFFDYDQTGITKAVQYIDDGFPVFLWEKLFDTWASKLNDSSKMGRLLRKRIVDLNDIAKKLKNPYNKLKLDSFFSKDRFDKIHITSL